MSFYVLSSVFQYAKLCFFMQNYVFSCWPMKTHKPLKAGKFCRADYRHNIRQSKLTGVDRVVQIFLDG